MPNINIYAGLFHVKKWHLTWWFFLPLFLKSSIYQSGQPIFQLLISQILRRKKNRFQNSKIRWTLLYSVSRQSDRCKKKGRTKTYFFTGYIVTGRERVKGTLHYYSQVMIYKSIHITRTRHIESIEKRGRGVTTTRLNTSMTIKTSKSETITPTGTINRSFHVPERSANFSAQSETP